MALSSAVSCSFIANSSPISVAARALVGRAQIVGGRHVGTRDLAAALRGDALQKFLADLEQALFVEGV